MSTVNGLHVRDDNGVPYQGVAQPGAIALSSPPANTNAGSDTTLTFVQTVHHWRIQNNTAAICYVETDATASTASIQIAAGASLRDDIACTTLHLYTAGAQPINAASGIVIRGWL